MIRSEWQIAEGSQAQAIEQAIDAVIEGWLDVRSSKLTDWQNADHILDAYEIKIGAQDAVETREALDAWLVAAKASLGSMKDCVREAIENKDWLYMNPNTGSVDTEDGWHPATTSDLTKVDFDWYTLSWVEVR